MVATDSKIKSHESITRIFGGAEIHKQCYTLVNLYPIRSYPIIFYCPPGNSNLEHNFRKSIKRAYYDYVSTLLNIIHYSPISQQRQLHSLFLSERGFCCEMRVAKIPMQIMLKTDWEYQPYRSVFCLRSLVNIREASHECNLSYRNAEYCNLNIARVRCS